MLVRNRHAAALWRRRLNFFLLASFSARHFLSSAAVIEHRSKTGVLQEQLDHFDRNGEADEGGAGIGGGNAVQRPLVTRKEFALVEDQRAQTGALVARVHGPRISLAIWGIGT